MGPETAARHPTILQLDLKTPQNVSLLDSDNPTTFPQRTGLTFFRGENDLDERRDFMLNNYSRMDSARLANRLVRVVYFLHLYFCMFDEGGGQTFSRNLIRMKFLRFGPPVAFEFLV